MPATRPTWQTVALVLCCLASSATMRAHQLVEPIAAYHDLTKAMLLATEVEWRERLDAAQAHAQDHEALTAALGALTRQHAARRAALYDEHHTSAGAYKAFVKRYRDEIDAYLRENAAAASELEAIRTRIHGLIEAFEAAMPRPVGGL